MAAGLILAPAPGSADTLALPITMTRTQDASARYRSGHCLLLSLPSQQAPASASRLLKSRNSRRIGSMRRKTVYSAIEGIDRSQLEAFQAGMRKRYSDEHILEELNACAKRLGRSPTMREFEADPETTVHPQTVIEHFKSWNRAKRLADLGDELGRAPTAKDIEARKGSMPSKSLYWHTFGSLNNALKEAGFDVPVGEERLERAIDQGAALAVRSGRLPKFADWAQARRDDPSMLAEWQVYRMFDARRGAWSAFQFLIRKRLEGRGVAVAPDGRIS